MKVNFFFFLMFSHSNLLQHMWARKEARREGARRTWACAHTPTEHALLSGQAVGARQWSTTEDGYVWSLLSPRLQSAPKVSPEADSAVCLCLVALPTSRLSVAFFGSFWCNSHSNTAIPVSWQNWLVGSQRVCSFRDRVYMMACSLSCLLGRDSGPSRVCWLLNRVSFMCLHWVFAAVWGLPFSCRVQASHSGGFSCCGPRA